MELVVGSPIQSLSVRTQWWGWFLGVVEGGVRGACTTKKRGYPSVFKSAGIAPKSAGKGIHPIPALLKALA